MPLSAAASSLADNPSTMKLLERLRWLETDSADARHRRRLGEELRARDVGRRDAWHEQRYFEKVAAVERQVLELGLRHGARDLAARAFEQGLVREDVDGGVRGEPSELQHHGHVERRPDGQRQPARGGAEPRAADREVVNPDAQVWEPEPALVVRDGSARDVRFGVRYGDRRARQDGARSIENAAADAGVVDGLLRARRRRRAEQHQPHRKKPEDSHVLAPR